MDKLLHLSFTEQRLDYIAQVLAQRPYAEVAPLMAEIARQIAQQQGEAMPDPFPRGVGTTSVLEQVAAKAKEKA